MFVPLLYCFRHVPSEFHIESEIDKTISQGFTNTTFSDAALFFDDTAMLKAAMQHFIIHICTEHLSNKLVNSYFS